MNTRVRRKPLGEPREPHPNARALYEHVERYLVGACNELALEDWRLAVARALELGHAMDEFIGRAVLLYTQEYGGPGQGRHAPRRATPSGPATPATGELGAPSDAATAAHPREERHA